MTNFQAEKRLVRQYYDALDAAKSDEGIKVAAAKFVSDSYQCYSYHPVGRLTSADALVTDLWSPLKSSLTSMQRRQDIFFAGENSLAEDGGIWVVSMGHLMGLFDRPLWGIRPSRKLTMLRYCEFNLVKDGRITDTAFYFDLPHLMAQAGQNPFPHMTGAQLVQPGPMTNDGLLFEDAPQPESQATLDAINAMINDLGTWKLGLPLEEELARTWHDDMVWWGPTGIGATYTIERYAKQHSGPFRASFAERSGTGHVCRMAEGHYGGFFGWPNFTAKHTGGFMGMPSSDQKLSFNVIDIYRRDGDKLAENWIFIDLLGVMAQQGNDILGRMAQIYPAGEG